MPIHLQVDTDSRMSLDVFIERVGEAIDLHDADSLIGLASDFRALANDPNVVSQRLNAIITEHLDSRSALAGDVTHLGDGDGFVLQAHIWAPAKLAHQFRCEDEPGESGRFAHNHNVSLMTVGHCGPGCITDVFHFDTNGATGRVGDAVDLQFQERIALTPQTVMIYRAHVDAHSHRPPESLSISLSLAMFNDDEPRGDPYVFDLQTHTLCGFGARALSHHRASFVQLAGDVGDTETLRLLDRIVRRAEDPRLREAAVGAILRMRRVSKSDRAAAIDRALSDGDVHVRTCAEEALEHLSA